MTGTTTTTTTRARRFADFVFTAAVAAVAVGAAASVVQTQINLADLQALGLSVPIGERATSTAEDLVRFGPVMTAIAAAGLLPAFALAAWLSRRSQPSLRLGWVMAAGVIGLFVAFAALGTVTPMRALVSATRAWPGLVAVCATGALGGFVHHRLSRSVAAGRTRSLGVRAAQTAGLVAALVAAFVVSMPRPADEAPRADPSTYRVEVVASGLVRPWSVAPLPDGSLLVTEVAGRLLRFAPDGRRSTVTLENPPPFHHDGGVNGWMDVVPDPAFARNGTVFLTMLHGKPGRNGVRVVRGRLVGERLVDVRVLFESTPKTGDGNNGGRLAFLPDRTFVLTVGDGNDVREHAQDLTRHQGKTVRLDRDGRVPPDNPFVGRPGVRPEIYSLGHRNAQGLAFDPANGQLLSSEHGARGGDELNAVKPGLNYGWPLVTDGIDYSFARISPFARWPGLEDPLLRWTPSIAPAGLAVHTGAEFAVWNGSLLVPAPKERSLRRVMRDGTRITGEELVLAERGERLRDVKVGSGGEVFVLTDGKDAKLLRLRPAASR